MELFSFAGLFVIILSLWCVFTEWNNHKLRSYIESSDTVLDLLINATEKFHDEIDKRDEIMEKIINEFKTETVNDNKRNLLNAYEAILNVRKNNKKIIDIPEQIRS